MIKKEHIKHLKEMNTEAEKMVQPSFFLNELLLKCSKYLWDQAYKPNKYKCVFVFRSRTRCLSTQISRGDTLRQCLSLNSSIRISTRCCMKSNSTAVRYVSGYSSPGSDVSISVLCLGNREEKVHFVVFESQMCWFSSHRIKAWFQIILQSCEGAVKKRPSRWYRWATRPRMGSRAWQTPASHTSYPASRLCCCRSR